MVHHFYALVFNLFLIPILIHWILFRNIISLLLNSLIYITLTALGHFCKHHFWYFFLLDILPFFLHAILALTCYTESLKACSNSSAWPLPYPGSRAKALSYPIHSASILSYPSHSAWPLAYPSHSALP